MVRVATRDEVWPDGPVGAFSWGWCAVDGQSYRVLHSKSPNGTYSALPIAPTPPDVTCSWNWDGNEDKPTLTPSVYHNRGAGDNTEWHGHFTAGRMVSCG